MNIGWLKLGSEARKFGVALGAIAAQLIAWGVVHGTALTVVQFVVSALGAVGVYKVRNVKPKPAVAPPTTHV